MQSNWTLSAFADEAGDTIEEQIMSLQSARIRFVDLRAVNGFNIAALPLDAAHEISHKLAAAEIAVQMFGSPIGKLDIADEVEADLQKLRHLAELAPVLGCNRVRVFSYYNAQNASETRWQHESLRRLRLLRDEATKLDLILFHENERHIWGERLQANQQIAELRDEHFRTIFDFDNYVQAGDDCRQNWEMLRDKTDAFHLKDSRGGEHCLIGEGDGQAETILRDALTRNWRGLISIEPHLVHSGAVAATGPSGRANEKWTEMPPHESFHIACQAAHAFLRQIGAACS